MENTKDKAEHSENIMGSLPVPRLILQTSIPLMLSLLMNSLYNFVDSVFISQAGEAALTALSLASPIQMLMSAAGCGIAVGLNAVISKALGQKDREMVKQAASASMVMAFVSWILIAIIGFFIITPYFQWQAAGQSEIAAYGEAYLRVCMYGCLGMMGQWIFDRMLIATGKSVLFLYTLGSAALINLILDPIFIFGYFGLPAMGTTGAALATIIGQSCGALLGIALNRKYNTEIPVVFTWKVAFARIKDILKIGIPTAIMQGVVSLMGIVMNSILLGFSSTAVAVYGVYLKIQNIASVGIYGISNALIPIVAYNFGAARPDRIRQSIRWALIDSYTILAIMVLLMELFPVYILHLFNASDYMLSIGIPAVRILSLSLILSIYCVMSSSVFQALGKAQYSMILTLSRQVVFLAPLAFLAGTTGNIILVWMAFCAAEVLTFPIGWFFMRKIRHQIIDKLPKPEVEAAGATI